MDTGASNHMADERDAFAELNYGMVGTMNFGDGSTVDLRGATQCCSSAKIVNAVH